MLNLRTFENRPGITYDEAKLTVIFAEDLNKIGTYLNNKKVEKADAGVFVTLDNLAVALPTTGNRSLIIKTTSGSVTAHLSTFVVKTAGITGTLVSANSVITTTAGHINSAVTCGNVGEHQEATIFIPATGAYYRASLTVGGSFNGNLISLERLSY